MNGSLPGYLDPEMQRCSYCDRRCGRFDLAAHEAECSRRPPGKDHVPWDAQLELAVMEFETSGDTASFRAEMARMGFGDEEIARFLALEEAAPCKG